MCELAEFLLVWLTCIKTDRFSLQNFPDGEYKEITQDVIFKTFNELNIQPTRHEVMFLEPKTTQDEEKGEHNRNTFSYAGISEVPYENGDKVVMGDASKQLYFGTVQSVIRQPDRYPGTVEVRWDRVPDNTVLLVGKV